MSEKYKCPICGKPTFKYYSNYHKDKLCFKHATELKKGKIKILDQYECFGVMFHDTTIFIDSENDKVLNEFIDEDVSDALKQCYAEWPRNSYNNCIICNKKSNGYAFCKDCYRNCNFKDLQEYLYDNYENNEDYDDDFDDDLDDDFDDDLDDDFDDDLDDEKEVISNCIICNNESNGYLFCRDCYYKYKNKELYLKITNCKNIDILDNRYESKYTSKDGHRVKSRIEVIIDNYLFDHNIKHAYETKISYGASENETISPDFYLPNYLGDNKDVYIEHWGYNDADYLQTKEFKLSIYKKLKITLICTNENSDAKDIERALNRKLNKNFIKEKEINFDE